MKLIKSGNRLLIVFSGSRFSFPAAYKFEAGKVVIWSLDDTSLSFKAPLSEVLDETDTPFASLDALEAFLFPLLGFKSATGGSVASIGMMPLKTGQTYTARDDDDGATQRGRGVDWFTLSGNNPFGNTQRFTGITGGYYDQVLGGWFTKDGVPTLYADAVPNHIICDWSTMDVNGNFLMWYRGLDGIGDSGVLANHSAAFTYCANLNVSGFNDWYVPNVIEQYSLVNHQATHYIVFGIQNGFIQLWTGTYLGIATINAMYVLPAIQDVSYDSVDSSTKYVLPVRLANISEL